MNAKPFVSVIMLTYNHEKYISQALNSVLMQEVNFDYEVLIGDDCSSDMTQQILLEYQHKYPKKIVLRLRQKNIGATKNAYELLMMAQGKYLATCEGDDYWTNIHKLQLQVDFLEKNPQFIGCTHKFLIVNDEGKPVRNQKLNWVKQKEIFTFNDFEGIYLPGQPSTFVRRNIFKNSEEDFSIIYKADSQIGDRVLIALFLLKGDFFGFDQQWSCYRKGSLKHVTSQIYSDAKRKYETDYSINKFLEIYLSDKQKENIRFYERRENIKFDVVISFLKHPSINTFFLMKKIYSESKFSVYKFLIYFLEKIRSRI